MTVAFELEGQPFTALNGGPHFKFTEAISFVVHCETQEEVDTYWEKLSAGGGEVQCGWLKDKFGLSWQVVPNVLLELLGNPDPKKAARVAKAMFQMKKLDIRELQKAARSLRRGATIPGGHRNGRRGKTPLESASQNHEGASHVQLNPSTC